MYKQHRTSSWKSLMRVRKMHLCASQNAEKNNLGNISQGAMAMTKFGFMGYALVRPHLLGINHDNVEDREAFVHLWAVLGSMLGIKDEFNMCLHPVEVVEKLFICSKLSSRLVKTILYSICRIFMRYAFIPFLQLETPTFTKLAKAFVEGLQFLSPFSSYESHLFLARRLAGVPGYQFDVDMSKEKIQRQMFSPEELESFVKYHQNTPGFEYRRGLIFDKTMFLIELKQDNYRDGNAYENKSNGTSLRTKPKSKNFKFLLDLLGKHPRELVITPVDENNFEMYLNDRKFNELCFKDKIFVKSANFQIKLLRIPLFRQFLKAIHTLLLFVLEKQFKATTQATTYNL